VFTDVIMPALGLAQETGKVLGWLKAEGEPVMKGEPLLEIETDKITVEIEAPASGTLARVFAAPGDEVPVGQPIAVILGPDETAERPAAPSDQTAAPADDAREHERIISPVAARIAAEHNLDPRQVQSEGSRVEKADMLTFLAARNQATSVGRTPASPKARRLAAEHGIELAMLKGSGPGGAVLADNVLAMSAPVTGGLLEEVPISATPLPTAWRVMAERMTQSWTSAPHFYLMREVDASRLITWRAKTQKRSPAKVTYTDLLVKLTAAALREHPRLNAAWRDGTIVENGAINVGLAMAVEDGLIVPVIQGADTLSVHEIAARRNSLVERAQAGKLRPEDIQGGTFTISNLGMYGVDAFNAIVNPPQAAILAVGRIAERVIPVNGQPAVRPTLVLSLSCDHRAVDGARGAKFLDALADLVEEPLGILI
jgi:pyruvate dehydrogenase E2 component (dihydrolipoamide acetyltransferase)